MAKIKKNDQVIVIAGRDRGKIGKVVQIFSEEDRLIVEKVNLVKKHTKPTNKNPQGGIIDKEAKIHISNVMLLDPKTGKGTRVGFRIEKDGKKVRVRKKSNEIIDAK